MKLKPVVASLIILGVVSPAFAKKAVVAPVVAQDVTAQQMVVDQNSVVSTVATDNWFNRISIGGDFTGQAVYSDTNPPNGTMANNTNSSTDLYVNNANLFVNAVLNSWSKASINLLYKGFPEYYSDNYEFLGRRQSHVVSVDEAYVTFANLAKNPFYAKVGKQYVAFGDYTDPYNYLLTPLAQVLEQNNQTAVTLGVATDFGPYASIYGFEGKTVPVGATTYNIRNMGAMIGWYDNLAKLGLSDTHFNVDLSWIRAIQDGDYFYSIGGVADPVGGLAGHIDVTYKQLQVLANYVSALKNLSDDSLGSTKVNAGDVDARFSFKTLTQDSSVGLGYQWSANGVNASDTSLFPKNRFQADYMVNLIKNVDGQLIYARDKAYSTSVATNTIGSTSGPVANIGLAKLMVKF